MTEREIGDRLDRIDAQLAGLVGVVASLIKHAAEGDQPSLVASVADQLEGLRSVVLADPSPHSEAALQGIDALQDSLIGSAGPTGEDPRMTLKVGRK